MANKVAAKKAPAKKAAPKKIELQKEFIVVGRVIQPDMKKAISDFMKAVEASDLPVSRKRMAEKIVRTRLRTALAV